MSSDKKSGSSIVTVAIPKIAQERLVVEISGPAILMNRMTDEAKDVIRGLKKPRNKRDFSEKSKKWRETLHVDEKGRVGFPAEAFLRAMASALPGVELSQHTLFRWAKNLYNALHVESDALDTDGVGIVFFTNSAAPEMAEHWAVIRGKSPAPIFRALLKDWTAELRIRFNSSLLTREDVILLVARAGLVGVGAFRPEKRGPYGTFVVTRAWMEVQQRAAAA